MTRVIVHAGFHKTGTSSLQALFDKNRKLLAPVLAYYGKDDFLALGTAARRYGERPFPHRRRRFRRELRLFLDSIPDDKLIIFSRETFSGAMPGHRRASGRLVRNYHPTAKRLAHIIISELKRRFSHDVDITFLYTTRARTPWLRSLYGHLLRSIRLTDDYETFETRMARTRGPIEEAELLSKSLPAPVRTASLEEYGPRDEGPAAALLDLADVSPALRSTLEIVTPQNTANSPELQTTFLRLNREIKDKAQLKAVKKALLSSSSD